MFLNWVYEFITKDPGVSVGIIGLAISVLLWCFPWSKEEKIRSNIILAICIAVIVCLLRVYTSSSSENGPNEPPSVTKRPIAGVSTAGTSLRDVMYDSSGKILYASEKINNIWVSWEYIYNDSGVFLYRMRNIGSINSTLTGYFVKGKDTTYSVLDDTIHNCVGFTLAYSVSNLRHGNFEGEREVYVSSGADSWMCVGTFDYSSLERVEVTLSFESPITFKAFATPRTHPDDSSFGVNQSLSNVWIADYEYVEIIS